MSKLYLFDNIPITPNTITRISTKLALFNILYPTEYSNDIRQRLKFLVSHLDQIDRYIFLNNLHCFEGND